MSINSKICREPNIPDVVHHMRGKDWRIFAQKRKILPEIDILQSLSRSVNLFVSHAHTMKRVTTVPKTQSGVTEKPQALEIGGSSPRL
jgi:hypothetical protein